MLYCQNHTSAVPIVILIHVIGSVCKTNALCNYAALSVYFDHSAKHALCNYAAFSGLEVTDTYTDTIFTCRIYRVSSIFWVLTSHFFRESLSPDDITKSHLKRGTNCNNLNLKVKCKGARRFFPGEFSLDFLIIILRLGFLDSGLGTSFGDK